MEGSLESPPIIMRSARWKLSLAVAGSVVFVLLGLLMINQHEPSLRAQFGGPASVVVFGMFALAGAGKLIRPDRLELSPSGLRFSSFTGTAWAYRWGEVSGFRLWKYRSSRSVVFDLSPGLKASGKGFALNRMVMKADATLAGAWPIAPEALLTLVESAQAHWGAPTEPAR